MERYEGYEAVVFDLDGTVVHLDVDWARVDRAAAELLAAADLPTADSVWGALDVAEAHDLEGLEELLADHECRGAESSWRLPAADELRALADEGRLVGVCSLNCEAAVRRALERHGLADATDAVVGRDTVETRKPHPEPLLATLRSLGVAPAEALFVGDSESDERTAERAGVDFQYVREASAPS